MRTPNTPGDKTESRETSSGRILFRTLTTALAAVLVACGNNSTTGSNLNNITTESNVIEWDRDSTKTGWINPSLKPGEGRWRGGKARVYKDGEGKHFILTENEAGRDSNTDGTYYPEEIRELTITPEGDTTGTYIMNHIDLLFAPGNVKHYVTDYKAETSKGVFKNKKVIPQSWFEDFEYEFGDLNDPKRNLDSSEQEEKNDEE